MIIRSENFLFDQNFKMKKKLNCIVWIVKDRNQIRMRMLLNYIKGVEYR